MLDPAWGVMVRVEDFLILINHRFRVSRKVTESSWRKVRSIRFADRNVEFLAVKRADGTSVRFALASIKRRKKKRLLK